jgi:hypothetical protein
VLTGFRSICLPLIFGMIISTGGVSAQSFSERALASGVHHYHHDPTGMGGGVAILDFNRDGHQDLYLTGGLANDQLLENQGDGTFRDVTSELGISFFNQVRTVGVVAGDLDNDGYPDLLVTTGPGAPVTLLRNEAGTFFRDVTTGAGFVHPSWSTSATLSDIDGDGDLDVYIGNYVAFDGAPFEEHITAPQEDFLYRNRGDGTFELLPPTLPPAHAGCTLATLFSDYDLDGYQDLFVLNDFGEFYEPNNLLRRSPNGLGFTRVSDRANMRAAMNAMGIAVGDLNGDDRPDYFITNIGDNRLYTGEADGTFTERARTYGVNDGAGMSWGTAIQDFNNDGVLDLYVNKGYLYHTDVSQNNYLFLGTGAEGRFNPVVRPFIVNDANNKARGLAWGDLNNDGALDLVAVGVRSQPDHTARTLIYLNESTPEHWLSVEFRGTTANRQGVGARVRAYAGEDYQSREMTVGGSYLSSHQSVVHFGLGRQARLDSLVIDWPGSTERQVIVDPPVNRRLRVRQDGAVAILETIVQPYCDPDSLRMPEAALPDSASSVGTIRQIRYLPEPSAKCGLDRSPASAPRVYPNPGRGPFYLVGGPEDANVSCSLYTLSGEKVGDWKLNRKDPGSATELTGLYGLPAGTYLLQIAASDQMYRLRIVVH